MRPAARCRVVLPDPATLYAFQYGGWVYIGLTGNKLQDAVLFIHELAHYDRHAADVQTFAAGSSPSDPADDEAAAKSTMLTLFGAVFGEHWLEATIDEMRRNSVGTTEAGSVPQCFFPTQKAIEMIEDRLRSINRFGQYEADPFDPKLLYDFAAVLANAGDLQAALSRLAGRCPTKK